MRSSRAEKSMHEPLRSLPPTASAARPPARAGDGAPRPDDRALQPAPRGALPPTVLVDPDPPGIWHNRSFSDLEGPLNRLSAPMMPLAALPVGIDVDHHATQVGQVV